MESKLQRIYNENIVSIFYILLPLIELVTTYMVVRLNVTLTVGAIYKLLFTIYAVIYLLFIDKSQRKLNYFSLAIIFIYCIINILLTSRNLNFSNVLDKLVVMSRFICFPVITIFLYKFIKAGNNVSLKNIVYSSCIYGIFIVLAGITGTGIACYPQGIQYGHSGWYYSGNEISNLLSMFYPIIIYYVAKDRTPLSIISLALVTYGLMSVGTKTSLFALVIVTIILFISSVIVYFVKKNNMSKKIALICIILGVFYVFTIDKTPAYKYMLVRYSNATMIDDNKNESQTDVDKFIFSGRDEDLEKQSAIYKSSSIQEKLLGIKDAKRPLKTTGEFNVIERDFYDILFINGIFGTVIFFIPLVYIIILFIKKLITNFKAYANNYKCAIACSVAIGIGISYIAGHVFLASTVAMFLALICVKLIFKENVLKSKKNIIIYMPKLAAGGMEISLINLLNVSKLTEKYNITISLGYVESLEYLEMLPKNISVRVMRKGKFNKAGKIIAALKYLLELIICLDNNYYAAICYSYHHRVLSILTRLASKNTILFMHTDLINSRTSKEINSLNNKVKFEKFNAIVCVSEAARNSMLKLYPNYKRKMIVANNYIDGNKIIELSKEKCENKEKVPCFINISRHFERAKKISRIIEASKMLAENGYKFKVWLVGDGEDTLEYEDSIKKLFLEDTVILKGRQTNPYKFLSKCDCLVISSDFEGYGMVIDEARVLKKPVISTDVADAKKILSEGYGIICANSKEELYEAMKEFLDNGYTVKTKFDYKEFNNEIDNKLIDLIESFNIKENKW